MLTLGRDFVRVALRAGPDVYRNGLVLEETTFRQDKLVLPMPSVLSLTGSNFSDVLVLEPCLESLSVLWSVTVYPSETFRFPIDLVFRKCRIVDPDLEASLSGRLSDVFIVRPLQGRESRGQSKRVAA